MCLSQKRHSRIVTASEGFADQNRFPQTLKRSNVRILANVTHSRHSKSTADITTRAWRSPNDDLYCQGLESRTRLCPSSAEASGLAAHDSMRQDPRFQGQQNVILLITRHTVDLNPHSHEQSSVLSVVSSSLRRSGVAYGMGEARFVTNHRFSLSSHRISSSMFSNQSFTWPVTCHTSFREN